MRLRLGLFFCAALANPLVSALQRWLTPSSQLDAIDALIQAQPPWILIVTALVLVLVMPVLEELFFRGICWWALRMICSARVAGALIAVLFSVLHGWPAALWLMPLAAGLSVLRARHGLAECVSAHCGWNFGAVVLPWVVSCAIS